MYVVATAGHVDHGKSALVRALTGMEPDRWAEERRRGMTLDLGFAWTSLPGVDRVSVEVAFVDVPGHERFVPTMLAGVGPVPAVVFVVAADGGWAAQSQEHLDALHALQVRHGLLVVTRSDLADPAPALAAARDRLRASTLGEVATVAVSAVTGDGLEELRKTLAGVLADLPQPDVSAPVRLWVDRAFTIRGSGTVVTGTLPAGSLRVGDELAVAPSGRPVRVRALQVLGRPAERVPAVARVAVNLRGVDRTDVARGCALVAPGAWLLTDVLDVRLRPGDPTARGPEMLMLHAGAAQTPARVRPLGPDTARLTLAGPLPLRVGDRVLLRDPAGHRVVAGATVLDPRPPRLHRRGAAAARARELGGMSGVPDGAAEVRRRGLVGVGELRAMGAEPPASARRVGDWLVGLQRLVELRADLCRLVEQHSEAHPLDAGLPVEAARARLGLPDARIVAALVGPGLEMDSGRVRPAGSRGTLPPAVERAVTAVQRDLGASPFAAPEAGRLAALGLGPREVGAAVRAGRLLAVAEGIVLLPDAPMRAVAALGAGPQPFSVSEARQLLGTTRRIAVPLLELLDRRGLTRRLPDDRRTLVPPGAAP